MKKVNWFLINENYGANLFPFGFHFDANYDGFVREFGKGSNHQSVGLANGRLRQGYVLESYNSIAAYFFKMFCNDQKITKKVLKNVSDVIHEFHEYNKKIVKEDLSILTDKQLAKKFEKFYYYFYEMSTWSVPFSYTEYGTPLWTNSLTEYLNTLTIPKKYTLVEIFQILSSDKRKTITAKERENILKLAIEVKKSQKLSTIFKKSAREIIKQLDQKDKYFLQKIKLHEKKYNWINFGFEGPLLDLEYFVSSIKDWVKNDPHQELVKIKKKAETLEKKQNNLLKQLKVDEKHKWMFWVVRQFGFQKAYRKDIEYYSYYAYEFLLKEFGRRFGLTVKQGHYLHKDEIVEILIGRKEVDINEVNERIKRCFYINVKGNIRLVTGKAAKEFNKNIKAHKVPKGLKKLQGQCACKGQAKGIVKVINSKEDYAKFKAGDILVSYATNPNMVPLMKKSAAVVTDEGGVTCHAAIVSRELSIPCVIGTRFATKILKDGQKVQIDATKGIVKKI